MSASPLAKPFNGFGLHLYHKLPADGNCFVSPLSVAVALGMLVPGARGKTLRELCDLLDVAPDDAAFAGRVAELMEELTQRRVDDWEFDPDTGEGGSIDRDVFRLHLANALFAHEGYPILTSYRDVLRDHFFADAFSADFASAAAAAAFINDWVREKTQDMIRDSIDPGLISDDTRVVLVNAVYFMAAWLVPFSEHATRPQPFYLEPGGDGESVEVPMMRGKRTLPYLTHPDLGLAAVEIPYEAMSMLVLLPEPGRLAELAAALDPALVSRLDRQFAQREVALELPRFEMSSRFRLGEVIEEMGLRAAFDRNAPDFEGITDHPQGLVISEVIHQARVRVDEQGTEAAAATAAMTELGSVVMEEPEPPIPFVVNRPFLFAIRDSETGVMLFLGRVMNPAE